MAGKPVGGSLAVQRRLVPDLEDPTFSCISTETFAVVSRTCVPGGLVRVEVTAPFKPITPLLGAFGPFDLKGSSTVEIQ